MTDKKNIKAIIHYKDFLLLSEEQIKNLLENKDVEFLISIKKEEYKNLSFEDKEKLYGFRRTIREPLKKPIINKEEIFLYKDFPPMPEIKIIKESFYEKHKKVPKPYCPRTIGRPNTKKKGSR